MPQSSRVPPLLQPYIRIPHSDSLLLLTSTLGASANWLIVRYLCEALDAQEAAEYAGANVILVSWMREYEFWQQEARKGGGLDLGKLRREGRFAFVDGLSASFLPTTGMGEGEGLAKRDDVMDPGRVRPQCSSGSATGIASPRGLQPRTLPMRGPPERLLPARGPLGRATAATSSQTQIQAQEGDYKDAKSAANTPGHYTLTSGDLTHIQTTIVSALSHVSPPSSPAPKSLLILDNPDVLLATNPTITPASLTSLILTLHTTPPVSHVLTHIQADDALLSPSTPSQPLELAHHNFLVKMAHCSRRITSTRVLDTGVARDVSGVVRVTSNGGGYEGNLGLGMESDEGMGENGRGKEFLYVVRGDGGVRVFERGAGGEG